MRMPSNSNGANAADISRTMTGPMDHATWVRPRSLPACFRRREFSHKCKRGGNIGAHGDADHKRAGEQHCSINGQRDAQDTGRIHEQIVLIDAFAAELVTKPPTYHRSDCTTKRVGANRSESTYSLNGETEIRLKQSQPCAKGDNRSGIKIGCHARQGGPFPLLTCDDLRRVSLYGLTPCNCVIGCVHCCDVFHLRLSQSS